MLNKRYTNSFDTTGRHGIPPPAKSPPSYCLTANLQCAYQSYKSPYTTPKCANVTHKLKQSKRPTRIPKRMLSTTTYKSMTRSCCSSASPRPRYDPVPYKVTKVQGTQITATRGDQIRQRDAKKFKKVYTPPPTNYRRGRWAIVAHRDTMITFDNDQPANNLTGTDTTTDQQPNPTPEPTQQTRTTPAPRLQAQQPSDLNRHPNAHSDPHTDSALPREQRSR